MAPLERVSLCPTDLDSAGYRHCLNGSRNDGTHNEPRARSATPDKTMTARVAGKRALVKLGGSSRLSCKFCRTGHEPLPPSVTQCCRPRQVDDLSAECQTFCLGSWRGVFFQLFDIALLDLAHQIATAKEI